MKYRPHWRRIIILAALLHVIFFVAVSKFWLPEKTLAEELPAVEWIDAEISDVAAPPAAETVQTAGTFAAIEMPPLEIPKIEFPPPPVIPAQNYSPPAPEEKVPEVPPPAENNSDDEIKNKIKVRVKVLPRDLISQLVESGAMPQGITLNVDKIILSLTIGTDGKTKDIEIVRGAGSMINLIARSAAAAWVFEPFLDEDGNPIEIKTELEFTAADF